MALLGHNVIYCAHDEAYLVSPPARFIRRTSTFTVAKNTCVVGGSGGGGWYTTLARRCTAWVMAFLVQGKTFVVIVGNETFILALIVA
jgi:hypothetical protein